MKIGIRTPSLKKRIAARTSVKRMVRHSLGLKAPRGMGWVTNPKKAAYNRVYSRTTKGCGSTLMMSILIGLFVFIVGAPTLGKSFMVPEMIYLPIVMKALATATPTQTPMPTATFTPVPSDTPIPSVPKIDITYIGANGSGTSEPDEYVEFKNIGTGAVQLSGWQLSDIANHVFTFPAFLIQPNQVCRVYTNQVDPAYCSFSYGSGNAIWNNGGDCAYLKDDTGQLMDTYCY